SEKKADLESPLKYEKGDETKEVKQKTQQGPPEKKKLSGVKKDLIGACKRYIEYVPEGERIVDVKYTMARVYYEHNHLRKAIDLFENLAFQHSNHRLAKVAANLHLDSLNLLNDFQGLHKAVERYLSEKPIDSSEFQSNVQRLNRAIRFKLCRKKEQKEAWGKAATCYVNIYRDFPDSKYVDEALYNAALSFERIKELGKAIQIRAFLLKVRPDSEFAPETLFNIGANYHALAVYSRAAQYYERFADKYPDHEKTEKALANAATFRQGLGQYEKAIADNEQYLELFGDEEEHAKKVADVAFQIARIYEKQDKPEEAKEAYETYLEEYADKGTLDRKLQAHVEIGLYHWNHGEREQALEKFRETLAVYNDLSKKQRSKLDEGRDAAARAKFMLGEKIYQEMAEIEVESSDEKELQKRFKKKLKVAKKAQKIYEEVIQFKRPDWAIAALYKIGAQYQDFAETIRNSPPPERLT
ncbi:MAG: tol-pal system YbgF family protein, partial [Bradymonadaceae bacterium]